MHENGWKFLRVFVSTDGFVTLYEDGTRVAFAKQVGFALQGPSRSVAMEVDERYAHVMAASVDLYMRLSELVDACDGNYAELVDLCNEALAKARGEQP